MGWKVKQISQLSMPLAIMDDFSVVVRRLGPQQDQALNDKTSRDQMENGRLVKRTDAVLWNKYAPEAYVDVDATAALEGNVLTPSVIRRLGVELEEDPPTNGNGGVHIDADAIRALWASQLPDKFQNAIWNFSRNMLAAEELGKKNDLMTSSA